MNSIRLSKFVGGSLLKTRRAIRWIGGLEPALLATLLLLALTCWGFVALAGEMIEGDTQALDDWVVRSLRRPLTPELPIGPAWLNEIGRDATALGGVGWLMFATCSVAGFLVLDRKPHMAGFLLASTLSGLILSLTLKSAFDRPRPEFMPYLSHVYTSSFPSGHSMLSAVVYITLGSLVAETLARPVLKVYVIALAIAITMIVGVSRVYLGVHYPTDVVAGWIAGLFWALTCSLIARRLQRSGGVEPQPPLER